MKQKWLSALCALALILSILPHVRATEGEAPADEAPPMISDVVPASPEPEQEPAQETQPAEGEGEPEADPSEGEEEPPAEEEEPEEEVIPPEGIVTIVGLAYGSNALPGANLENSTGKGYSFGYLDSERSFHVLGSTQETKISVVKTRTTYYGTDNGYKSYSDKITSDIVVGCFHIEYAYEPKTFEEALELAQGIQDGFPAWIDGSWHVRSGAYVTRVEAQAAAEALGAAVGETSSYGVQVVKTGTSKILFQFDGGNSLSLCVSPGLDRSVKAVTWFKGYRYYGAFQYRRINGGNLTVSNVVLLDDYAECVVSREMSSSWPLEALKAGVVCARNYFEQCAAKNKHKSYGFDICNTTDCQVYYGMGSTNARTAQAASETKDMRIWYNGKLAEIYYFSSDGGATEDVRNVWSGNADLPYLCGVIDPYEATVASKISGYNWTVTYTAVQLTEHLRSKGYNTAAIVDFRVTELTPTGNVKSIAFIDANGKSWPFVQEKVRTFLGLRSIRYTVTPSGQTSGGSYFTQDGTALTSMSGVYAINGSGTVRTVDSSTYVITSAGVEPLPEPYGATATGDLVFTINGSGWGHNIGMSQWGAYAMANLGFSFEDILTFYFPGVEIY